MCNAYGSRWLLLLAALGAMAGCAKISDEAAFAPVQLDPRLVAERHFSPETDPAVVAATRALEARWAKMPNATDAAPALPLATAPREQPVIQTAAIGTSDVQQPAAPPVTSASGATTRRSLFEKQPWEVELDNMVRGICRGC